MRPQGLPFKESHLEHCKSLVFFLSPCKLYHVTLCLSFPLYTIRINCVEIYEICAYYRKDCITGECRIDATAYLLSFYAQHMAYLPIVSIENERRPCCFYQGDNLSMTENRPPSRSI